MSRNEVVEEEVKVEENLQENVTARVDLNKIVSLARFEEIKNKYGVRHPFMVTFFNGKKLEFVDKDGLYDLLASYKDCGMNVKDLIKFRGLVEEQKINEFNEVEKTYICYKFEFNDGTVYRMFARYYSNNQIIKNYFDFYNKKAK